MMLRSTQRVVLLLGTLNILPLLPSVSAEDVSVRIAVPKPEVIVGEPVLMTVTVTNEGTTPVELIHHTAPTVALHELSLVELQVGTDPSNPHQWTDQYRALAKTSPRTLAPGKRVSTDLVMLFARKRGFFANTAGTYWIRCRAVISGDPYVEILSDAVKIELREPSTADRPTWEWLDAHKDEYGHLVQAPSYGKLSNSFLEQYGQLCRESDSTYVEYMALSLSRWYREGPGKDRAKAAEFAAIARKRASTDLMARLATGAEAHTNQTAGDDEH